MNGRETRLAWTDHRSDHPQPPSWDSENLLIWSYPLLPLEELAPSPEAPTLTSIEVRTNLFGGGRDRW